MPQLNVLDPLVWLFIYDYLSLTHKKTIHTKELKHPHEALKFLLISAPQHYLMTINLR